MKRLQIIFGHNMEDLSILVSNVTITQEIDVLFRYILSLNMKILGILVCNVIM